MLCHVHAALRRTSPEIRLQWQTSLPAYTVGAVAHTNDPTALISGSGFKIGTSLTATVTGNGFLNLYANDILTRYSDNSGQVIVTVSRIQ